MSSSYFWDLKSKFGSGFVSPPKVTTSSLYADDKLILQSEYRQAFENSNLISDFSYNHEKLSKFVGKSRSYIANSLRLLGLPDEVLSMVETGDLSAGHARSLIGLNNAAEIAKKIISVFFTMPPQVMN